MYVQKSVQVPKPKQLDSTSYAPIARALNAASAEEQAMLRVKFGIADHVATDQLVTKYPKAQQATCIYKHDTGASYAHVDACKEYNHYIAESNRKELKNALK